MKIFILQGETGRYPEDSDKWLYSKAFENKLDAEYTLTLFQRKLEKMETDGIPWVDRQLLMEKYDKNFKAYDGVVCYSIIELELT